MRSWAFIGAGLVLVSAIRFGANWIFRRHTAGRRAVGTLLFTFVLLPVPIYLLMVGLFMVFGGNESRQAQYFSLAGRICWRWFLVWVVIETIEWLRHRKTKT